LTLRGQTKVLANQVDIENRERLRLKKDLQFHNIIAMDNTQIDQTKKHDPLRKVQEDSEARLKRQRKDGMIGELSKLFLHDKPKQITATEQQEEEDGYEMAQGMWEGWEDMDEAPEDEDAEQEQWVEEEEAPVVRPSRDEIMNRQSTKKSKQSQSVKNSTNEATSGKKGKNQKENIHPDESFGEYNNKADHRSKNDLNPGNQGDHIDLSSIISDTSEYTPQRRNVYGQILKGAELAPKSRKDEAISFNGPSNQQNRDRKPENNDPSFGHDEMTKNNDKRAEPEFIDSLQIPPKGSNLNIDRSPSGRSSRRGSINNGEGSQRELRRGDSFNKSNLMSSGSGSKSVLQVKKRDKSDMMANLARIHAQRVEDQEQNAVEEADDEDVELVGIDWEKRIRDLQSGQISRGYRIPGERMEERIKRRKGKTGEMDKWGVKSVPRKKNLDARNVSYRFKNTLEESEKKGAMNVNIEMLHTDELMAYYRELIAKGNRDFSEHQRFQNQIKKLEYENTLCTSKSPNKNSVSPDRENKIIDRYMRNNSPEHEIAPDNKSVTGNVSYYLRSQHQR
jgi:hypothetical protein